WNIIEETGKLLWLVVCLVLVAFDWLWDGVNGLVNRFKDITAEVSEPGNENYFSDAGKALLEASKNGAIKAVKQAREQLDLPKDGAPRAIATTPQESPAPQVAAPAPKATPQAVAKTTTAETEAPEA
ncbi:MAG: hypothetical protein AAGB01_07130, partial [Cyanobacteria bacterium P01_F01_bin.42]